MSVLKLHPVGVPLHTALRLYSARPWGVFRESEDFYIADYSVQAPYVFSDYRSLSLSGDDISIFYTGEYWRCESGVVYTGTIDLDGVASGDEACTGLGSYSVRSLSVWLDSGTYKMVFRHDSDPSNGLATSQIIQGSSTDKVAWESFSNIRTENYCDIAELIQQGYQDADEIQGAGTFQVGDTYVLEDVNITNDDGSMVLRIYRIGTKTYWGSRAAWTALGADDGEGSYDFFYEADFTITGQAIDDIYILQVLRS